MNDDANKSHYIWIPNNDINIGGWTSIMIYWLNIISETLNSLIIAIVENIDIQDSIILLVINNTLIFFS